jgi:chaperonin cofactor prefoldin
MAPSPDFAMGNFSRIAEIVMAVGLYGVNTNFTIMLFCSGFSGWEVVVRFAFAVFFEGSKIGLWVEGLARRSWGLVALSLMFSVGSLTTASVGMIVNELAQVSQSKEALEYENLEVTQASEAIDRLEADLAVERSRLAAGSALYRTDAKETRARIDELESTLREAEQALREAETRRRDRAAEAPAVAPNPLAQVSQWLGPQAQAARLAFGFYQALMLELGGLATSALAIRRRREDPRVEPKEPPVEEAREGPDEDPVVPDQGRSDEGPTLGVARIAVSPRSRNGTFPSFLRVSSIISRAGYDDIVRRGLLAGVLRRRGGRVYVVPEVTAEEFAEEVEKWPG